MRADLCPGSQAVQAIHAMREFVERHPEVDREWFLNSNYLALLSVEDENELHWFIDRAATQGIKYAAFKEPDLDNQVTALVLEPGKRSKRLCARLPLALK